MKLTKRQQEFIKEAHEAACSTWQEKIENEFPKLFEKEELEVGKWYKLTEDYGSYLKKGMVFMFVNYLSSNKIYSLVNHEMFGINTYNYIAPQTENLIPATDQEVEEALIKEAKKRGFKNGVEFIALRDSEAIKDNCSCSYDKNDAKAGAWKYMNGVLYTYGWGRYVVFEKGKWATIIEDKKEMTIKEIEKELGYSIKIINNG